MRYLLADQEKKDPRGGRVSTLPLLLLKGNGETRVQK
jgi:hypothetical protein